MLIILQIWELNVIFSKLGCNESNFPKRKSANVIYPLKKKKKKGQITNYTL